MHDYYCSYCYSHFYITMSVAVTVLITRKCHALVMSIFCFVFPLCYPLFRSHLIGSSSCFRLLFPFCNIIIPGTLVIAMGPANMLPLRLGLGGLLPQETSAELQPKWGIVAWRSMFGIRLQPESWNMTVPNPQKPSRWEKQHQNPQGPCFHFLLLRLMNGGFSRSSSQLQGHSRHSKICYMFGLHGKRLLSGDIQIRLMQESGHDADLLSAVKPNAPKNRQGALLLKQSRNSKTHNITT